jgi:hypothetical protein
MTIGRLLSYCRCARVCRGAGWAAPAIAVVVITLVCGSELASAQRFSASALRPSVLGTKPRISTGNFRSLVPQRRYSTVGVRPSWPQPRQQISTIGVRPSWPTQPPGGPRPSEPPKHPGGTRGGFGVGPTVGLGSGAYPPHVGNVLTPGTPNVRLGPPNLGTPPIQSGRGGGSGVPPANERRYVPDEVMVELSGDPSDQTLAGIGTRHGLNRLDTQRIALTNSTWVRWRIVDRRSVPAVIRVLEADPSVRSAQPNYLFALQQQNPAVPRIREQAEMGPTEQAGDSAQYALAKLHLPEAQAWARGNRIVVAVIDTEIDKTHSELSGAIVDSYDALGIAAPMEAHGTGIAGTIAARAKLLGAAPGVSILAIRAFGGGSGTTMTIIKGLDYAVAHDARIINMSFAGPVDPALTRALVAAHHKGRILIAAAGNKGPKSPALFPAADPNVIAVTATDSRDKLFDGANRGDHIAVAAPGVDILVPAPGNVYRMSTGTSFASAFASGVAALLAERKPDLTPEAAKNVLMSTARDLGPKGQFGAGLMDANQAILSVTGRPAAEVVPGAGH